MPRLRLRLLPREIPLKTAPYLSSRVASLRGKETSLLVRLRDGWTCSKSHFLLVFSIPFSTLALRRSTRCRWLRQLPCFYAKDSTATRLGTSPKGGDGTRGSGTLLVMDELVTCDTIKNQTEKPLSIISGALQTRVFLITPWSSCWIAGALF
jgi:hypothetical protein